ncbi:MAG: M1 family aminopeptidase [Bacteroidales bacterium]|jgi:aminopeptidase N|nr:M1 family aminopeptidase [Bacteroidales bacterium]
MKKIFTLIVFLLAVVISQAQRSEELQRHQEREWKSFKEYIRYDQDYIPDTNIDVKFYCLDLNVAIDSPYIEGVVICHFEPLVNGLQQVKLSLHKSLSVTSVDGNASSFLQTGDSIMIDLDGAYGPGDEVQLYVHYEGTPVLAGGYKGLVYQTHNGDEPVIATLSTPYLAHYWYPCKDGPSDKPDSVHVDITIPVREVNGIEIMAVSNGILEGVIDNGTTKTYMWRHRYPIVPYYVMVAISNYVKFSEDYIGVYGEQYPLDYYVFQEHLSTAQAGIEDLPLALDVFSEKFGEYPFSDEKYGMTQLGFYGAIENQTNTIQNNLSAGWFMISVHELGHMWFGDMITCRDWHHGWLNEGFASYLEAVYVEEVDGSTAYHDYMEDFEYWNGGTLYLQNASDTFNIFQGIIYNKGAYTLHMLRGVLGDEVFWDCMYAYSTDPDLVYGQAVTGDLQEICEDISGEDLDYFFEQWIYDEYYPEYDYNFKNRGDSLDFLIWQTQEQLGRRPLFTMPMEVLVSFESGHDTVIEVRNDEIYQVFTIPVDEEVLMITPDPGNWILCKKNYRPDLPVGIADDIRQHIDISIYPNPVESQTTLRIRDVDEVFALKIYSIDGKLIKAIDRLEETNVIARDGMEAGLFLFVIQDSKGNRVRVEKVLYK